MTRAIQSVALGILGEHLSHCHPRRGRRRPEADSKIEKPPALSHASFVPSSSLTHQARSPCLSPASTSSRMHCAHCAQLSTEEVSSVSGVTGRQGRSILQRSADGISDTEIPFEHIQAAVDEGRLQRRGS